MMESDAGSALACHGQPGASVVASKYSRTWADVNGPLRGSTTTDKLKPGMFSDVYYRSGKGMLDVGGRRFEVVDVAHHVRS